MARYLSPRDLDHVALRDAQVLHDEVGDVAAALLGDELEDAHVRAHAARRPSHLLARERRRVSGVHPY